MRRRGLPGELCAENSSLLLGWSCPHGSAGRVYCHESFLMMLVTWVWRLESKEKRTYKEGKEGRGGRKKEGSIELEGGGDD